MLCMKCGCVVIQLHNLTFQIHIPEQTSKQTCPIGSDNHTITHCANCNGVRNDRTAVA